MYITNLGIDAWNAQKTEPLRDKDMPIVWFYRDYAIRMQETDSMDIEDVKLHMKHLILKKENRFEKMKKEVERFEKFEKLNPAYREQIPEDVRMFVWRRDEGKCVKCQRNENLEFDHIIPLSKGGSNTERNIQLLCAECNKRKSNNI